MGIAPPGFQDTIVLSGLVAPTAVRFSPDGRVFVAEKSGRIRVFPALGSTTPTTFVDLATKVHNYWDRGLLGLALHPNFPTTPYVYALYTHDAAIGATAPRWNDACPTPPGPTTDGCLASGRLSRFTASGNVATGAEQVLIEDWCTQYPSHSVADVKFGPDGALYVSGGDGASFTFQDYGQGGGTSGGITPRNPCGDPPGAVGGAMTPPTARGGRLRSQSLRRPAGEPVVLDGAILRVDGISGAALPTNPLASHADPDAQRIVGYGTRNPFRFAFRPGTNEVWVADAGDLTWEEIDRIVDPLAPTVSNFGWPCYEGTPQHGNYQAQNLDMCNSLYATPTGHVPPYYAYHHDAKVVAGESCPTGGSVIAGISFYDGPSYPAAYRNALFFADHSRNCIWAMKVGTNGLPDPTKLETFVAAAANPVAIEVGPGGDLFYVDHEGGAIHRISYPAGNQAPTAVIDATPTSGLAPLAVAFDGTGSSDPEAGGLSYEWDLDGDGAFDDSTASQPAFTYAVEGSYDVGLRVRDSQGATGTAFTTIVVHQSLPEPVIDAPLATVNWAVGEQIEFSGHATDDSGAPLPASALTWTLILNHCPSTCHTHTVESWSGTATGSFDAPDHDYPSSLDLVLTATDASNRSASTTVRLDPRTVDLTFASSPSGLELAVGVGAPAATPFTRTFIVNSAVSVAAQSPQTLNGTTYTFGSWSDGGAASHSIVVPATAATYTATFNAASSTSYLSDLAYTVVANGYGPAEKDRSNGGTGAGDGGPLTLAGVVYPKGIGTHAAAEIRYNLTGCSQFTVKVGLDDVVGANGSLIFQVYGDAVKLADSGVMTGASPTQTLTVDLSGRSQLRLVVNPNGVNYYDHADWADARLTCGSGPPPPPPPDTTPPTITGLTPTDGATGQATTVSPTATFSEPIDPASLTGATFSLVASGTTTPLAAGVTYNPTSRTATLDPTAALAEATTYVVTVRGGSSGVRDAAGVALVADRTWTFTTAGPSGGSQFQPRVDYPVGTNPHSVVMFDVNADTRPDLIVANSHSNSVGVLLANSDGTFATATSYATGSLPKFAAVADFNGDGKRDLVSANQGANGVSVLLGSGTGTFAAPIARTSCSAPHEVAAGDFNKDGNQDVAVACWNGTVIRTHLGNGDGTLATGVNITTGDGPHSVVMLDLNADTNLDVVVANRSAHSVSVLLGNGTANFAAPVNYSVGTFPHEVRAGDINADGKLDLVTANDGSDSVSVLLGAGNGTFAAAMTTTAGLDPVSVGIADLNLDGKLDVITANTAGNGEDASGIPGGDNISILLGTGTGSFSAATSVPVGLTPFSVTAGDVDGNGSPDVVTANWHGNSVSVLRNALGSGPPPPPPPDTTPPTITGLTPTDGATGQATTVSPTATFSEPIDPASLTGATFSLVASGTTTPLAAGVTYNPTSRTATLDPTAALAEATTYVVTVRGGSSGVRDAAGVALVADRTWTFTTAGPSGGGSTSYLSDLAYTVVANGYGPAEKDRSNGGTGAGDGGPLTLAGVVYPKGIGTHAAAEIRYNLTGCSQFTVKVGLDDVVGANGSLIFQVYGDAVKLADSGVMTGASPTQTLTVDLSGRSQLRLVVNPNGVNYYDHADWADARLTCGSGPPPPPPPDTTPPTITGLTPTDGATGQATTVSPTATFSEPIDPASLTGATFSLVASGTTTPLAAGVTYNPTSRTATLDPTAALAEATTYVVTVRGGSSGVRDAAGVALVADRTWTFTTAGPSGGGSTSYLSDLAYTVVANGYGPAEKDRSNGGTGAGDGGPLTLAGVVYPKGIGTHAAAEIRYNLTGCSQFTVKVGLDDVVGANGSLIFQVYGDAVKLADSGVMTGASPTQTLTVDLSGRSQLRLVVNPNGVNYYDHADWADARLTCGS